MRWISRPAGLAAAVAVVAFVILASGLGDAGFWTDAELPIVDRARAALGEQLSGLERSPWFPDEVRTIFYDRFGGELGIRIPHAIAVACLAGVAAALVRRRGGSALPAVLAGVVVLSFPATTVAGRTVLGNPLGELVVVGAVLCGVEARRRTSLRLVAVWTLLCSMLIVLSVSSVGLVFGAAAPLIAIAVYHPDREQRWVSPALAAVAVAVAGVAVYLCANQGDGYIPILGAAKDLELIDKPEQRRYAAALEDFGYQIFPWVGLAAAGAVRPQARWPALWATTTLALAMGWSVIYGPLTIPATVPAAMCIAAAAETIIDPDAPKNLRRVTVLLGVAGALVMRKDADLYPSRVAVPQHDFEGEHNFPDEAAGTSELLRRVGAMAGLGMLLAALIARRRDDEAGWERFARRVPDRVRDGASGALLVASAAFGAWSVGEAMVTELGAQFSARGPMTRYQGWVDAGELQPPLATHRVRDDGLEMYGPTAVEPLKSRNEVFEFLRDPTPRAALVRINDVAPLHQHAHLNDWSFFVVDDSHAKLRLVSNALPSDAQDRNRIPEVLVSTPPKLAHETLVQFEQYVTVIGWEVTDPLVRGRPATFKVVLEVLRPLPGGSKLYARFMDGRLSKINTEPVDFVDGLYPCNLWRAGDFIVHTQQVEVPPLEILPGTYDVVLGIRRSERKNLDISVPEERTGDFGVLVRDKKRNFARIGQVEVW